MFIAYPYDPDDLTPKHLAKSKGDNHENKNKN